MSSFWQKFLVNCTMFTLTVFSVSPVMARAMAERRELAHPKVKGAAGPYSMATLTLTRPIGRETSPFTGSLDIGGGQKLSLAGPDEPDGFFYLDPKAVIFTSIDRSHANGIVVLYNSSQIGPGNGTNSRALVYKVEAHRAVRQPVQEARLEGIVNARQVRARLKRADR